MAYQDSRNSSNGNNKTAMELFKVVCQNGGVLELGKAVSFLSLGSKERVQKHGAARFVQAKFSKIFRVRREQSRVELEAIFPFAFCEEAARGTCVHGNRCVKLHLCPYFVKGKCQYKGKCRLSHNKRDTHTMELLRAVQLENIDDALLDVLLSKIVVDTEMERGASSHTIPDICKHYNNQGGCSKKDKCAFLHICKYYVDGECKFPNCKRIHDVTSDPHNQEVLKKFRLGRLTTPQVLSLLRGRIRRSSSSDSTQSPQVDGRSVVQHRSHSANFIPPHMQACMNNVQQVRPQPVNNMYSGQQVAPASPTQQNASEICGFFLKGQCNYGNKCMNLHRDLPYQWQFQDSSTVWQDFPADTNIMAEQHYCSLDANLKCFINQHSYKINFDNMIAEPLG